MDTLQPFRMVYLSQLFSNQFKGMIIPKSDEGLIIIEKNYKVSYSTYDYKVQNFVGGLNLESN